MLNSPAARASHSKSTPRTSAAFSGGPGGYAACAAAIHGMSSTIPIARIRNAPLIHGSTAPSHTRLQYRRTRAVLRSSSRLCRRPLPGGGAGRSGFCVRALHKVSIRSADISRSAATHITFTGGFPVWRERYRFRHFGPNDGLNTAVSRLVQNRAGFLWVATGNGLFRYDGARVQRFGVEQRLPSHAHRPRSPGPAAVSFRIVPPWWDTWWFRSLAAGAWVLLIGLAVRSRMNRVRHERRRLKNAVRAGIGDLDCQNLVEIGRASCR